MYGLCTYQEAHDTTRNLDNTIKGIRGYMSGTRRYEDNNNLLYHPGEAAKFTKKRKTRTLKR